MSDQTLESLPVIFRAERSGPCKGDVTAVFPTVPGTGGCHTFTVYAHIGQHGQASRSWYNGTRRARPDEYADLLTEIRRIYENPNDSDRVSLRVVQRMTRHHLEARRAELVRIEGVTP